MRSQIRTTMNAEMSVVALETTSATIPLKIFNDKPAAPAFRKVRDSRGRPIRGLWQRNDRFYAQFRVPGKKSSTKVCLKDHLGAPVKTVAEARAALHELLSKRRN